VRLAAVAVCSCLLTAPLWADSHQTLELGTPVTGTLEEGARDTHWIDLEAGQFVYGEVDQLDVDVKITVYDAGNQVVGLFDGPSRGADPIQLDTESDGRFRIEVATVENDESGSYTLTLEHVEPIAAEPEERLGQLLSQFAGDDVPGAVVAVIRGGKVVHSEAVGMANLTFGIPFTRQTVSNIGSVSKQFTAFAVTRLAQSGALSLDDDVREHFPELPDLGQTVTVRDLLRHTNGYREFLNLLAMSGRRLGRGDYIGREEVIEILQRQTALQDEPGSLFNYNNSAYALAALLVERVADVPFPQWLADNLFTPLGMDHTRLRASTGEIIPNAADGYLYGEDVPFRQATDLGGGGGATMGPGGIYTTVDDLALWIGNLRSGAVGGEEVIAEMTKPQIETPGSDSHYGLGLALERHRGLALIQHGGADTAHRAMLLYYPEIDAAVVTLSNHGGFPGSIARKTAEAFFAEQMEPEEADAVEDASVEAVAESATDAAAFEPFAGKYEFEDFPGIVIEVSLMEGQVMIRPPGEDPLPVSPTSATTLSLPPDTSIEFHPNASGEADSLTWHSTRDLVAHRLDDWSPTPEDLDEYVGRYFSEELGTFYAVEKAENGLIIAHSRLDDIELTPKVKDTFSCSDVLAEVAFSRNDEGALTGLMASNIRTRDVWFERAD
jgi:CubicO group peptidase (beta-lactamase class C family)